MAGAFFFSAPLTLGNYSSSRAISLPKVQGQPAILRIFSSP